MCEQNNMGRDYIGQITWRKSRIPGGGGDVLESSSEDAGDWAELKEIHIRWLKGLE